MSFVLALLFVLGLASPALGLALGPKPPISEPPATVGRSEGPKRPGGPVYPVQEIRVRGSRPPPARGFSASSATRGRAGRLSSQNDLPTGETCDAATAINAARPGRARQCSVPHAFEERRVTATTIFPR
jgi:hypothetical protein